MGRYIWLGVACGHNKAEVLVVINQLQRNVQILIQMWLLSAYFISNLNTESRSLGKQVFANDREQYWLNRIHLLND